jgi:hypothetical protein
LRNDPTVAFDQTAQHRSVAVDGARPLRAGDDDPYPWTSDHGELCESGSSANPNVARTEQAPRRYQKRPDAGYRGPPIDVVTGCHRLSYDNATRLIQLPVFPRHDGVHSLREHIAGCHLD